MSEVKDQKVEKRLIICENGEMVWEGFEDEYQQLGFLQIQLNQRAIQTVASQIVQGHARRLAEEKKAAKGAQVP